MTMADNSASPYNPTTEAAAEQKTPWCTRTRLGDIHLILKVAQLVLSFVAFICEEIIDQCENCGGLYFFEFVSCSAFLLAILMLVVYCSPLGNKINIQMFKKIDFGISLCVGVCFVIASIVFAATMDSSKLGTTSVVFGFLASAAFLIEVCFMWRADYLLRKPAAKQNEMNATPEGQPLQTPTQAESA